MSEGVQCVGIGDGAYFCYPEGRGKNDFFIAIDQSLPPAVDSRVIYAAFNGRISGGVVPQTDGLPAGIPPNARIYNVTAAIPSIIRSRVWSQAPYHGPNCYQSAFCAAGLDYTCRRYVDSTEAEFLLSLFFYVVSDAACGKEFGTIAIFHEESVPSFAPQDSMPINSLRSEEELKRRWIVRLKQKERFRGHVFALSARRTDGARGMDATRVGSGAMGVYQPPYIDAGTHMAFSLMGGLVFHKLSPNGFDGYTINAIDGVGKELDTAVIKHLKDPIDRWTYLNRRRRYTYRCVAPRKEIPNISGARLPEADRKRLLMLLDFYSDLVLDVSSRTGTDSERFEEVRLSLITVENMWAVLREIEGKMEMSPKLFLSRDFELAKAYFRAYSLSWQYVYMSDQLYEIKEWDVERRLEKLYLNHYFKPDERFVKEIEMHLKARGIPREMWKKIAGGVIERIRIRFEEIKKDPNAFRMFYRSNGGSGLDFSKILDEEINRQ